MRQVESEVERMVKRRALDSAFYKIDFRVWEEVNGKVLYKVEFKIESPIWELVNNELENNL